MNSKQLIAITSKIAATINAQARAMRHVYDDLPIEGLHTTCDHDVQCAIDAIDTAYQMVLVAREQIRAHRKDNSL